MLLRLFRDLFSDRKAEQLLAQARNAYQAGGFEDAGRFATAAALKAPHVPEVHYLLGMVALKRGDARSAVPHLKHATDLHPGEGAYHFALGEALQELGAHEAACEHLARALELLPSDHPRLIEVRLRLAASLQDRKRFEEALALVREVLAVQPDSPGALLQLAMLRFFESDGDEARRVMDRYVARRANAAALLRRALMMPVVLQSNAQIDALRARVDRDLDELIGLRLAPLQHPESEVMLTPFYLAYHGRPNRDVLAKFGRAYRAHYPARREISRKPGAHGKRLRIGFVSSFFYSHSVARTTYGLLKDLPREHFETWVLALGPFHDATTEEYQRAAGHFSHAPADVEQARAAIEAAELDVLLYADIGMHPVTTFLSQWRLAPLQLVTWGHSVTSGIDTVDYYVSSETVETPTSDEHYSERLMRLPGYFLPRYRQPLIEGARKPRAALGLPEEKHVYLCPQSLFKLHPDFDQALAAILERDPQAEIALLNSRESWIGLLRARFARTLGAHAARIRFLPAVSAAEFLHYLAAADVIIDPFYFGGCNTSAEALSLGVPIVTLPSFQLPGRFTLGLYRELEIDDCIARDPRHFVELALRVGTDGAVRRSISARIAERAPRLFDRPDTGRAFGAELLRIAGR